ncbi:MAG: hypothetical protein O2839_08580 [Cyanobacteria bacterium]|nr:hypothetical protein [Cyanobacteriota bacterium]
MVTGFDRQGCGGGRIQAAGEQRDGKGLGSDGFWACDGVGELLLEYIFSNVCTACSRHDGHNRAKQMRRYPGSISRGTPTPNPNAAISAIPATYGSAG